MSPRGLDQCDVGSVLRLVGFSFLEFPPFLPPFFPELAAAMRWVDLGVFEGVGVGGFCALSVKILGFEMCVFVFAISSYLL